MRSPPATTPSSGVAQRSLRGERLADLVEAAAGNFAHAVLADLDAALLSSGDDVACPAGTRSGTDRGNRQTNEAVRRVSALRTRHEAGSRLGSQTPLTTHAAKALGFANDGNLATLVERALAAL